MIPKIVLSAWFGRGKKSDLFLRCREAKEKLLPKTEWNYIDVDEDNCGSLMSTPYMQAVVARGEFVKCTELARIWALLTYGGVYMDEDVEPVRPFEPLLETKHVDGGPLRFFVGREGARVGEKEYINGAVMGSEKSGAVAQILFKMFPSYSDGREKAHFYGPGFLTREVESLINIVNDAPDKRSWLGGAVLKKEAFCPFDWFNPIPEDYATRVGPETFAVHHFFKSWVGVKGC